MANKDYYQILGVDEKADSTTIKRVYRKLAKECHPDAHPGDHKAEERFKEISEAYNTLSDEKKRKQYDQMRRFGFQGARPGGFHQPGFDFDFNDIFSGAGGRRRRPRQGDFNLDDFFGFGGLGDLFTNIFDKQPQYGQGVNGFRNPNDIYASMEIPFETAVLGGKTVFSIPEKNGKQFSVNIPPGTEDGKKMRLSGHGHPGQSGFPQGDLIVTIRVPEHRFFRLEGIDIHCEIPLEKKMAQRGTKVRVKTIHGSTVELKIPPETKQGRTFRLKGLGVKGQDVLGDQYVKIKLQ